MYIITTYTKKKAKKLNVIVLPSEKKNKKQYGKKIADERKRLYKIRHKKDRLVKGSPGYYADQLLW